MSTTPRLVQARIGLRLRRVLAERARYDALDEAGRAAWRDERLRRLREHAVAGSALYRERHAGLTGAPLRELPITTKDDLVERFDDMATAPGLRRAELEAHVAGGPAPRRGLRVVASSGSSGRPGLLAFDEAEWVALLANAARARALSGRPAVTGPVRSAKVGSPSPWHGSHQLPATLHDPRKPALALSATTPLPELVAALAGFAPHVLSAYPSMLRALAAEQEAGRLGPAPVQAFGGGEPLTDATREAVARAFGHQPFDQYVTTEAGFVAAECEAHDGLHVLDDHVVLEVADDHVLVTPLHGRTVPLVRYRLDDLVVAAEGPCPCGRPTPRLRSVGGRARELVRLAGAAGAEATLHPVALSDVLDRAPVRAWQVRHRPTRLRVLVADAAPGFDPAAVAREVAAHLSRAGAAASVVVEVVDALPRQPGGKAARVLPEDQP